MSSVTMFISLFCLFLHCTGVERMHICTYPCHAHAYSRVGPLVSCKSCVFPFHLVVIARLLTDLETRRFWYFYYFTLVAEQRSAMSGATDRREEEHVPHFYGRIDGKFAEWETDVRLWQVEFKLEDRDRLEPRLYRRGLHGQPKIFVKTKLGNTGCCTVHSGQHHPMPQRHWLWRTS